MATIRSGDLSVATSMAKSWFRNGLSIAEVIVAVDNLFSVRRPSGTFISTVLKDIGVSSRFDEQTGEIVFNEGGKTVRVLWTLQPKQAFA